MGMTIQPLNAPYDVIQTEDGRIAVFARIQFTADDVTNPDVGGGGAVVAGQVYDPTSHITTRMNLTNASAAGIAGRLKDHWGMTYVEQIEGGVSSSAAARSGIGANSGQVKARFVELGATPALSQYLELRVVGGAGPDAQTLIDEAELDNIAAGLTGLTFDVLIHGIGSSNRGQS